MVNDVVIASDLIEVRRLEGRLLSEVVGCGYNESAIFAIKLALEEALNNSIRHGNGFDRSRTIQVSYEVDSEKAAITISDEGNGFDPSKVPDPTVDENLEKPCGRGIMLMRAYMDEVRYNSKGNQVYMVKRNI